MFSEGPDLYRREIHTWLTVEHNTLINTGIIGQGIFDANAQLLVLSRWCLLGCDCSGSYSGCLRLQALGELNENESTLISITAQVTD